MQKEVILKQIWNWQITIPLLWRKLLNLNNHYVKAIFDHDKVIIKPLEDDNMQWDIKKINFNGLNNDTQDTINKWIKSYKKWEKKDFISHNNFW